MFKTIITCSTIISFLLGIFLRTCSSCMKNSQNKESEAEHPSRSEIDKSDFGKASFYHVKFSHQQPWPMCKESRDSQCLGMKFSLTVVSSNVNKFALYCEIVHFNSKKYEFLFRSQPVLCKSLQFFPFGKIDNKKTFLYARKF